MDAATLGEWSRYLVSGAVAAYIVGWLAFCGEAMAKARSEESPPAEGVDRALAVPAGMTMSGQANGSPVAEPPPARPRGGSTDSAEFDRAERPDRSALFGIGRSVTVLGTLLLAIGVVFRAVGVGRVPWGNMYEFAITGSLVAAVIFVAIARTRVGRALAVWLVLMLFLTLGLSVTVLYVPPGPLVPALRSYWLVIHVGAAVVAFGLFLVSAVVSGLQIAAERAERRGVNSGVVAALPEAGTLDRVAYRVIAIAFPIWTFGPLIMGSIWAEVSWGRYWGWDPKEVWALITWLVYAAYLHARATAGWKGSKASAVALVGFATVLFSYFGVNIVFNGLHSYGGL